MKRQILISLLILLFMQAFAPADVIRVPSRTYPNIQSALDAAHNGWVVEVKEGVYSGSGNRNLDFGGKAIILKSAINPDSPNWDVIANTIIDCGGKPTHSTLADNGKANRAFWFHTGEGSDSVVLGFTIRNGYARGHKGADGRFGVDPPVPFGCHIPFESADPVDMNGPPIAERGKNSPYGGVNFGGAILCGRNNRNVGSSASPTIKYCIIEDCTVTGGEGGKGADGQSGPWAWWPLGAFWDPCALQYDLCASPPLDPNSNVERVTEFEDGQWGGDGGDGFGIGYGAAIACRTGSSPIITDCIFRNNIARGGVGGDGGNGGNATTPDFGLTWEGSEGGAGDGGWGWGDGMGGVIYADGGSSPIITSCTFEEDAATTGLGGKGGSRGGGDEADPRAPAGFDGIAVPDGDISGGVAYYSSGTTVDFTNCTFTNNGAYELSVWDQLFGLPNPRKINTVGGALYFKSNNTVNLNNCDFIDNLGGAVYCGSGCNISVSNDYDPNRECLFTGNSDANDRFDLLVDTNIDYGSGGAFYVGTNCTVNMRGCNFGGNSAKNEGGALKLRSDATLTNCSFGDNAAGTYGGAIDLYDGTLLTLDVNRCTFIANQAVYGGAFSSEVFEAAFINCYFSNNVAEEGGALDVVFGDLEITGGGISGNHATVYGGGGLYCQDNALIIQNCIIKGNSADGLNGSGGAISLDGRGSHQIKSCLIVSNAAIENGGAIHCDSATPQIEDCTFDDSLTGLYGGAIFSDWDSLPQITRSIFRSCNKHAIHEEDPGGNAVVTESLFYNNPDGDYYDSGTHSTYTGPSEIGSIPGGLNSNIYGNPLFVSDSLGDYYLSQIAAGQPFDSPAVDAGSVLAVDLGLDDFTTRTDSVGDANEVDLGYHYPRFIDAPVFSLRLTVVGGEGTLEATAPEPVGYDPVCCVYWYYAGTSVTITATPEPGWRLGAWGGTDDDSSTETINTVLMNSNRTVTVEFEQPRTLTVGVDTNYPTIEEAIGDAEAGDTIIVPPGVWYGPVILIDKPVILRSSDPNNPAAAVIDRTEYVEPAFVFGSGAGPGTVLDGFTIRNCRWQPGYRGIELECPGFNGPDGWPVWGGAIRIDSGASPIIKNCIIRDNWMRGGEGQDGCGSDDTHNAGRGGWGGFAWGGGVYCGPDSTVTLMNCQIVDNHVGGGNGGDGGAQGDPDDGLANYGGNWSAPGTAGWPNIHPEDTFVEFIPDDEELWQVWRSWPWVDAYGNFRNDYIGDYRWYTAYGGGAFCDVNSTVVFIDCTIHGNRVSGGMSGNGGDDLDDDEPEPEISYQLPSYGGGVYCAANSDVTFNRCTITDNVAARPDADLDAYIEPGPNDPRAYYHLDPYLGHGGGVCAENTAVVTFIDCLVGGNEASVGGGVYFKDAEARITDSVIILNAAYQGGGLFGINGPATIIGCSITNNEAFGDVTDPNGEENDPNNYDPNDNYYLPGDGGGIHCDSTMAKVVDCVITGNTAGASGGGAHFTGPHTPSLINCLLADNTSGKGGGGVSVSVLSQLTVSNSTIADNTVSGSAFPARYGGGLYCFNGGNTDIIDSILWANSADLGPQIAVEWAPAAVSVTYSDVQDGAVDVFIDTNCVLNWDDGNNLPGTSLDDPCFVFGDLNEFGGSGDFFLSQPVATGPNQLLSPCVDAGSDDAHALGLYRHTTRTDGVIDGIDPWNYPDAYVDLGYHYVLTTNLVSDFDFDGDVDIDDLYRFNLHWLNVGCEFPDWCHGKDLNQDGRINMEDYAIFAENFQLTETLAPMPNPMTWELSPYAPTLTEVKMIATTATDNSGLGVEYNFERVYPDYINWPWDPCETHVDSNLTTGNKYGYRVRARDALNNMTDWSFIGYAVAGEIQIEDRTPPKPDPMTWQEEPHGVSASSVYMVATIATDVSGPVQYYFEETTGLPGGTDSGWQNELTYTDTDLMTGAEYRYRVRARDSSMWRNANRWSSEVVAIPSVEPPPLDVNAPSPVMWDPNAVNFGEPYETGEGMSAMVHMTAAVAVDPEGRTVLYYFECVDIPGIYPAGYSSGWIALPTWSVFVGRVNQGLRFRFRVADSEDGVNPVNVSGWSSTLPAYPQPW